VAHDLNREPRLPFPDAHFDAALCAVSVQYLVRPVEVFAEVARVLRPGGVCDRGLRARARARPLARGPIRLGWSSA
jgi:ubiquinone/menaquinone biosynthesis C-methylase UbiE